MIKNMLPHYNIQYEGLGMLEQQRFCKILNLDIEFRTSKKGRKRNNFSKSTNTYQLVYSEVLPVFLSRISQSSSKEREIRIVHDGRRFVWHQLLKDVENFFKLVFQKRFHRLDKRNDSKRGLLVQQLMKELGISHTGDEERAFHYFYRVLTKLRGNRK